MMLLLLNSSCRYSATNLHFLVNLPVLFIFLCLFLDCQPLVLFLLIGNDIFCEQIFVNLSITDVGCIKFKLLIFSNKIKQFEVGPFLFLNGSLRVRFELPPRPHSLPRQQRPILTHDRPIAKRVLRIVVIPRKVPHYKYRLVRLRLAVARRRAVRHLV